MSNLKTKIRGQKFSKKFNLTRRMEKVAAYDIEYANNHDMNEILGGNEAYQEFMSNKNYDY